MYEIEALHGLPDLHGPRSRPSVVAPLATPLFKMIVVLVRVPETRGHRSVARITSANIAVLLVPSVMATTDTPLRIAVPDHEAAKIPAPDPLVLASDVVPTQPR